MLPGWVIVHRAQALRVAAHGGVLHPRALAAAHVSRGSFGLSCGEAGRSGTESQICSAAQILQVSEVFAAAAEFWFLARACCSSVEFDCSMPPGSCSVAMAGPLSLGMALRYLKNALHLLTSKTTPEAPTPTAPGKKGGGSGTARAGSPVVVAAGERDLSVLLSQPRIRCTQQECWRAYPPRNVS